MIEQQLLGTGFPALFNSIVETLSKIFEPRSGWQLVRYGKLTKNVRLAVHEWSYSTVGLEYNEAWLRVNVEEEARIGLISEILKAKDEVELIRHDAMAVLVLEGRSPSFRYAINDEDNRIGFQFILRYEFQLGTPPLEEIA